MDFTVNLTCLILRQTDVVTSMKALLKLVDVSQLSSRLDSALCQSRCDWMELHQVTDSLVYHMFVLDIARPLCNKAVHKGSALMASHLTNI